jgi:hypothetical protein
MGGSLGGGEGDGLCAQSSELNFICWAIYGAYNGRRAPKEGDQDQGQGTRS